MKRKIMVFVTEEQHEMLKKESERLGSSFGSIIRQALMDYFSKKESS